MHTSDVQIATRAALSIATDSGLQADDVVVLRNSDKLMLRLLPCDLVARVEHEGRGAAEFEVELARRLADVGSPAAVLDPRIEARAHRRDGFAMSLWTYYEPLPPSELRPDEYADALVRQHRALREIDMETPHFTDRVADAYSILGDREISPELVDDERELLDSALRTMTKAIDERGAPEQPLHGEPHPGNVLRTKQGPVFVDLETCCRGPVEYDIAHAVNLDGAGVDLPADEVAAHYPGADPELVRICRVLMLAMITTWRWNKDDQLPDRLRLAREWTAQLRRALEAQS